MGDELYMYPQYDKDINNSYTNKFIHIINAPKGQYHGTDSYSRLIDGDQWIVSITSTNVEDATIKGTENDGNVHVSSNPDMGCTSMGAAFFIVPFVNAITRSGTLE